MRMAGLVLLLITVSTAARADGRVDKGAIGVGIVLGEPTGITAKLYLKDDQAVQVTAGSNFIKGGLSITGDYLFHPFILQERDSFVMPFYVGPGVRLIDYTGATGYFAPGLRLVAGMLFDFKQAPLDAFVEVAGVAEYGFSGHGAGGAVNAGAGVRYYF